MVRLAAFVALLAADAGEPDVILGTHVGNRSRVALQNVLGYFVNLVPLRFRYQPDKSFREWISDIRAGVVASEAGGHIPHEQLRDALRQTGIELPAIHVICDISTKRESRSFAGLELTPMARLHETAAWGFTLIFDANDEEHGCRVNFDVNFHDPARVRETVGRLRRLLDGASRHPDGRLADLLAASR
jgi:nonribosomal peptide synthetase protein BlmIV